MGPSALRDGAAGGYLFPIERHRRHIDFKIPREDPPAYAMAGGCAHWLIENVTAAGYDLVHVGREDHGDFSLPMIQFASRPAGSRGARGPHRPLVMIVEDDDSIRSLMVDAIGSEDGYRTVALGDGAEALRALATVSPDLMLIDIGLPGVSGLVLYDRIRALPGHASMPVLFVTAKAQRNLEELRKRKIPMYLQKPFELSDLLYYVRKLAPAS